MNKYQGLCLAVKAMIEKAVPNGHYLMLLVFWINPRIPITPVYLPEQRKGMNDLRTAKAEILKKFEISRTALRWCVPVLIDFEVCRCAEVLVFRGKPKQWVGPRHGEGYLVVFINEKQGHINDNGIIKLEELDHTKRGLLCGLWRIMGTKNCRTMYKIKHTTVCHYSWSVAPSHWRTLLINNRLMTSLVRLITYPLKFHGVNYIRLCFCIHYRYVVDTLHRLHQRHLYKHIWNHAIPGVQRSTFLAVLQKNVYLRLE